MTYRELKRKLDELTEIQLEQTVRVSGEDHFGKVEFVQILDEDYVNPSGECAEPVSAVETDEFYTEKDLEKEPRVAHKGDVYLLEEY